MPFAGLNGVRTHFLTEGFGQKTVLVIHGLSPDLRMWDDGIVNGLNRTGYQLVRYDIRGHGESDAPDVGYCYRQYARDAVALFDHLQLERVAVVGLSLGGGIALQLALDAPERVAGAVLIGSSLPGRRLSAAREILTRWTDAMHNDGEKAMQVWLKSGLFDPLRHDPKAFEPALVQMQRFSGKPVLQLEADEEPVAVDRLSELRVPVLTLVGEHDPPDFHAHSEAVAAEAADAERVTIAGAGQCASVEKPQDVLQHILPFLRRCAWAR